MRSFREPCHILHASVYSGGKYLHVCLKQIYMDFIDCILISNFCFAPIFLGRIWTYLDEIAIKISSPKHCLTKLKRSLTKLFLHDEAQFTLAETKLVLYLRDEY